MSHPSRFKADDPYLARLREVCLALPEAAEKVSHGHPNFYTTKVFAVFGGVVKGDHYNTRWSRSVLVRPDLLTREQSLADDRFFVPAFFGAHGGLALDLAAAAVDWSEVAELLDASYRHVALHRMLRALDQRP